jgi:D-alanyl-D-alanine carboxypeptidase
VSEVSSEVSSERPARGRAGRAAVSALVAGAIVALAAAGPVLAGHWRGWEHNHSNRGVPPRPEGLHELRNRFGPPCGDRANNARTWFPHAVNRGVGGYVYYHPYLAINVGNNIRNHINAAHRNGALDYGIYGYNCRLKTGGSEWSTHAFGAAIDTNTARNPYGQDHWNGKGADGHDHGLYIPDLYRGAYPGHRFVWGKQWSDPHHFQYVSNY